MIIDYKKIENTNTEFYHNHFENLQPDHHLVRTPGEWYKLLTYISYLYDDILILDVGTNWGESAIALSQNKNNRVISYDIKTIWDMPFLKDYSNLEFKLMDIKDESDDIIKQAKIIVFDIAHDGIQEKRFTDKLKDIDYKGYMICDDIYSPHHPEMRPWWDSLTDEKYDITDIGHSLGTGLVNYYNDKNIKIIK
jgi:hypothetical protein